MKLPLSKKWCEDIIFLVYDPYQTSLLRVIDQKNYMDAMSPTTRDKFNPP